MGESCKKCDHAQEIQQVSYTTIQRRSGWCGKKDNLWGWRWVVLGFVLILGCLSPGQCHVTGGGKAETGDQGRQGLRNIIYCTFLKHGLIKGESKPPTLSHIRVSRGPEDYNSPNDLDIDDNPDIVGESRSSPIKSPSYQHKLLNRISQFHGSSPYSSDLTYSLRPFSHSVYPVASVQARGLGLGDGNRNGNNPFNSHHRIQLDLDDDPTNYPGDEGQSPTFTPYIGSRILSNLPKFFEHLHDNIKSMHDSRETLPGSEDSSISLENDLFLNSEGSSSSLEHQMDMPARRGDYFQSDGRLSVDLTPGGGGYRYSPQSKPAGSPQIGDGIGNGPIWRRGLGPGEDYATNDMLKYMGRDPKYKKANNYNPSWLFTNLGLGKRSVHQKQNRFHQRQRN